ncbi:MULTISPECIES: tannase/feruloyl esterase family alpha/beta hydrolase [unclassified Bradyrhizobium]|uniref:tannase/feruloyl esterase family alpha/beta hydrolase n=1 Tax=unclassified Bradyrhizobium TaxID=2631580 RepID=UPI0028E7335B|nr:MULTISPECIES: tannase/feruloyl esterase family alpha/beta hydrolase [unclassified Bradyrhizobium]
MTAIRITTLAALVLRSSAVASVHAQDFKASCAALAQGFADSGRVVTAEFVAAGGVQLAPPAPAGVTASGAALPRVVRRRHRGRAGLSRAACRFAWLFLFAGMNHCGGGPATNQFHLLTALDQWVEGTAAAPEAIRATARRAADVPWPGRTRDLCAFPKVLTSKGSGSLEDAANFECR